MKKKTLLQAFFLLLFSSGMIAQPEFLDSSFGIDGKQTSIIPEGLDIATDLALLPNGKTIVAGISYYNGLHRFSLARFHPDGSLDLDFGVDGINHTLLPHWMNVADYTYFDRNVSVAIQPDGKIIATGGTYLIRFLSDGQVDEGFGYHSLNMFSYAVALQEDGKIVVAGGSNDFRLKRFHPDGSLDETFVTAPYSYLSIDFGSVSLEAAFSLLVQPDGKILVGGSSHNRFALARLNENGTLDPDFGTDGKLTLDGQAGVPGRLHSLALQPDSKIVGGGSNAIIRIHPDGTLDDSFAENGILNLGFAGGTLRSISIGPGECIFSTRGGVLMKVNTDGSIDDSFGDSGILEAGLNGYTLAIQADQKMMVVGRVGHDFGLSRFLPDGLTDPDFNSGEVVRLNLGNGSGYINDMALLPDGRILVTGSVDVGFPAYAIGVARYHSDGSWDEGFSTIGLFLYSAGANTNTDGYANDILVKPDGKLVVGGKSVNSWGSEGILFQLNPDGSKDSAFFDNHDLRGVNELSLQTDNKIVAIGWDRYEGVFGVWSGLVRYYADGPPPDGAPSDTTFTSSGSNLFGIGTAMSLLSPQPDGKILAAGAGAWNGPDFVLYRFHPDGAIDESFGADGMQATAFEDNIRPISLDILADGKILMTGSTNSSIAFARYLQDGSPDHSFGTDGKVELELGAKTHASALLPDEKILAAGEKEDDFFLAHFLPDGTLDESAGINGIITTDFDGADDQANAILVQPDGKILLAGESDGKFALARYLSGLSVVDAFDTHTPDFSQLSLFPNPTADFLYLQLPKGIAGPIALRLFDVQGRLLRHETIDTGQRVNVEGLPSGSYLIKVMIDEVLYMGKFVKE